MKSEIKSFKVECHICIGKKYIEETEYLTKKTIKVTCPECNGEGFVIMSWQEISE